MRKRITPKYFHLTIISRIFTLPKLNLPKFKTQTRQKQTFSENTRTLKTVYLMNNKVPIIPTIYFRNILFSLVASPIDAIRTLWYWFETELLTGYICRSDTNFNKIHHSWIHLKKAGGTPTNPGRIITQKKYIIAITGKKILTKYNQTKYQKEQTIINPYY